MLVRCASRKGPPSKRLRWQAGDEGHSSSGLSIPRPAAPCQCHRWSSATRPQSNDARDDLAFGRGVTRLSNYFIPTFKADSLTQAEASIPSLALLLRGGHIRQSSAGVYTLLPIGLRIVRRISELVEEEMDGIGASRLEMPTLLSSGLWKKSGRWDGMGSELFKLTGRGKAEYLLAPTHEEEVTKLVADEVESYRQLPVKVYQISRKYRNEPRPRSGMLRTREFYMKDLYTFDADIDQATASYQKVREAYARIYDRLLGQNHGRWLTASADTGSIGGKLSHEYHFLDELGEDNILSCPTCGSAANQEMAQSAPRRDPSVLPMSAADVKVQLYELGSQVDESPSTVGGTESRGLLCAVIVPEDRQISDIFVQRAASLSSHGKGAARFMDAESLSAKAGSFQSFEGVEILIDEECAGVDQEELAQAVADKISSILGARPEGFQHSEDVPSLHDFFPPRSLLQNDPSNPIRHESSVSSRFGTFRQAEDGDACSACATEGRASRLSASKSIEVGHTFLLGTKYSEALQAGFTPADPKLATMGSKAPFQMGCYGIGVSRILGAIAQRAAALGKNEQLIWPRSIAPFKVCIITGSKEDPELQVALRSALQALLRNDPGDLASCIGEKSPLVISDIVIDDRDMSVSRKLKDGDIFGFSAVIILGKAWKEKGMAELIVRDMPKGEGFVQRVTRLIDIT